MPCSANCVQQLLQHQLNQLGGKPCFLSGMLITSIWLCFYFFMRIGLARNHKSWTMLGTIQICCCQPASLPNSP